MYFIEAGSKQAKYLSEGISVRPFWGNNIMLALVDLEANAALPNHPHEQGGIILTGTIEFTIAGETRLLKPGDLYIIPGGVEHSVKVCSAPAQVLDIFYPIREDLK